MAHSKIGAGETLQLKQELVGVYESLGCQAEIFQQNVKDVPVDTSWVAAFVANCRNTVTTIHDRERKRILMGSTSNGKSTFVNAFLNKELLPSGLGSTTSQVLCVCGAKERDYIVKISDKKGKEREERFHSVKLMIDYINKYNEDHEREVNRVNVTLPLDEFPMLGDNVVLIDSPGMGHDISYNNAMEATSGSVRSLILLCNIESDFSLQDKEYMKLLYRGGTTTSVPYIVMNKWDRARVEYSGNEDKQNKIKSKQRERCLHFLTEELRVSKKEAEKKIYFLSGKMALKGESWARDSFKHFFKDVENKENEAMCLKNIPDHQKSVNTLIQQLMQRCNVAIEAMEARCNDHEDTVQSNDTLRSLPQHTSQQLPGKLIDDADKVAKRFEAKVGNLDLNVSTAKGCIMSFLEDANESVNKRLKEEIESFALKVSDGISGLLPINAQNIFWKDVENHKLNTDKYQIPFKSKAMESLDAMNEMEFKKTQHIESEIENRKVHMDQIRKIWKSDIEKGKAMLLEERKQNRRMMAELHANNDVAFMQLEMQKNAEMNAARDRYREEIYKEEQKEAEEVRAAKEDKRTARDNYNISLSRASEQAKEYLNREIADIDNKSQREISKQEKRMAEKRMEASAKKKEEEVQLQIQKEREKAEALQEATQQVKTGETSIFWGLAKWPSGPTVNVVDPATAEQINREKDAELQSEVQRLHAMIDRDLKEECDRLSEDLEEIQDNLEAEKKEIKTTAKNMQDQAEKKAANEFGAAERECERSIKEANKECKRRMEILKGNLKKDEAQIEIKYESQIKKIEEDSKRRQREAEKMPEDSFEHLDEIPDSMFEQDYGNEKEFVIKEECKEKLQTILRASNKIFSSVSTEVKSWMDGILEKRLEISVKALRIALEEEKKPLVIDIEKYKNIGSEMDDIALKANKLFGSSSEE